MKYKQINGIEICEKNRFTKEISKADEAGLKILQRWYNWFCDRGIPCAIGNVQGNFTRIALYREGLLEGDSDA